MSLELYRYINSTGVLARELPKKAIIPESVPLQIDAKEITLSEYDPYTRDLITAHKISDYRRKSFSLNLLPKIHTIYDTLLEGSFAKNVKFYDEDPYS